MEIIAAQPTDLEKIKAYQMEMAWQTEELKLDEQVLTSGIKAVFDDPSKGKYYVAKENGDVIACLLVTYEWSEWRNGTVLWIQSVFVESEHRGKGIFKKMYAYLQEMVKTEDSLMGLRLYVEKTNLPAQKVYNAIGMNGDHYHFYEWMKEF